MSDLFQTVEYSRDKWTMNRVPLALLFCLAGMVFAIYVDARPPGAGIPAALLMLLLGVVGFVALSLLLEQIFEGRIVVLRVLAGIVLIALAIAAYLLVPSSRAPVDVFLRPRTVGLPGYILGPLLIMGAVGFITFALFRHFRPARPIVTLSPAGLSYHGGLVKNLTIPWSEIEGVDGLQYPGSPGFRYPDMTVVLLSQAFYERYILPQRSILRGPRKSWDMLFVPKGPFIQMVLHYTQFSIDPKDVREPIEARWNAFKNKPPSALSGATPIPRARQDDRKVHGRWQITGSLWQAITFLVPLIGILAILAHAMGVWPR